MIGETTNVAAQNTAVVQQLQDLMQNYIDRGRSTPGAARKNEYALTILSPEPKR